MKNHRSSYRCLRRRASRSGLYIYSLFSLDACVWPPAVRHTRRRRLRVLLLNRHRWRRRRRAKTRAFLPRSTRARDDCSGAAASFVRSYAGHRWLFTRPTTETNDDDSIIPFNLFYGYTCNRGCFCSTSRGARGRVSPFA